MKKISFYLLASVLFLVMPQEVYAQSLEIGGIELHIGQKIDAALNSLASYQVQYKEDFGWMVSQMVGSKFQFLGTLHAKNGLVSHISKEFIVNDGDLPATYTRAHKELQQRGGTSCVMNTVGLNDGLIHAFETQCGSYKLVAFMPFKNAEGQFYAASVSIAVPGKSE